MNEQHPPLGIEWTRIYGRRGYTWNPITGCLHGCTWQMPDGTIAECYAKTQAESRRLRPYYSRGFEAHYWHADRLNEPLHVKKSAGIFVGSMADLFGHWVPQVQIDQVLDVMRRADWHIFQTLSKYPIRVAESSLFPNNCWVGISLPAGHLMSKTGAARALKSYLKQMVRIEASVRFMSIEPLWFDVAEVFEAWIDYYQKLPFEWAIIGAASKDFRYYQPEKWWVERLLAVLDRQQIPVFFKGNLDWQPRREQFPGGWEVAAAPKIVLPEQLRLL